MAAKKKDTIVKKPDYINHIQHFFEQEDIDCMNRELDDFDLSTYEGVRKNASRVFSQTLQPDANMPPQADRKWNKAKSQTFRNWMINGYPLGLPKSKSEPSKPKSGKARVRKDIRDLSSDEIKLLKKAFETLKNRDPSDKNSFTSIAEIHGLPNKQYCLHHEGEFQPWHRAYLKTMEDALRTVEGCENITLPYWDISGNVPAVLFQKPFDSFVLQKDASRPKYPAGYKTVRNTRKEISDKIKAHKMKAKIERALSEPKWEDFNYQLEQCHDSGHVYCGETIVDADVTAYDPMFWFFHCNWDRLWWRWQHAVGATNVKKFKATTSREAYWLKPPVNDLEPFAPVTSDQTIAIDALHYAPSRNDVKPSFSHTGKGRTSASSSFMVSAENEVSLRVKGINRLKIPGSFLVTLLADGEIIDREGFFQSSTPFECKSCREKAIINIDFNVPLSSISNKKVSIKIDRAAEQGNFKRVSIQKAGNPTINIRHTLINE